MLIAIFYYFLTIIDENNSYLKPKIVPKGSKNATFGMVISYLHYCSYKDQKLSMAFFNSILQDVLGRPVQQYIKLLFEMAVI